MNNNSIKNIVLIGNPNSGKTAIFNLLTGLNHDVSNYPGTTVEKRIGKISLMNGEHLNLMDLPGTYSLIPESLDEEIVSKEIYSWIKGYNKPDLIISVIDSTNLNRNLYLTSQLLEFDIPIIIALNMIDLVENKINDMGELKSIFNVEDVIPISAKKNIGISKLKDKIINFQCNENLNKKNKLQIPTHIKTEMQPIIDFLIEKCNFSQNQSFGQTLRLLSSETIIDFYRSDKIITDDDLLELLDKRNVAIKKIEEYGIDHEILEATFRYDFIDSSLNEKKFTNNEKINVVSRSEKVDKILTHHFFGPIIFIAMLYCIFQSIFTFASVPMDLIDGFVGLIGNFFIENLPSGLYRDLLVEGIIAGIGAILIFLPQIIILLFFLNLLENSGYMARVAFMMDRFMKIIGLHGKSILPLMSGYACAIPGILSARTIENWKERLITILILPLMSCSARLPVYALMISAFIPEQKIFGIFGFQGVVMVAMYFLGTVTAMFIAFFLSRIMNEKGSKSFIMELPSYRIPLLKSVFFQLYVRTKMFLIDAGKIIMTISILLWFLASFPRHENQELVNIENSYIGRIGHVIEPVIQPLGFDWKIGVCLITSFAAREVVVSTLATLYNVENSDENFIGVSDALKNDINPHSGLPRYTALVAISIMVFFVYAAQCMATFAIVRTETNSWKWPMLMVLYMTILAYMGSLLVFQGGQMLGLS